MQLCKTMSLKVNQVKTLSSIREIGTVSAAAQSKLRKPPEFDEKKFVAKWIKVSQHGSEVEKAKAPERLGRFEVDGWQVWKNRGKPHFRALADGRYILMFRPKEHQAAVNAIAGNISRERIVDKYDGRGEQPGMINRGVLDDVRREDNPEAPATYNLNEVRPRRAETSKNIRT